MADGPTLLTWLMQAVSAGPVEHPKSDTLQSHSIVWKPDWPRQRYLPDYEKQLNESEIKYLSSRWEAWVCMQHLNVRMAGVAGPSICTRTCQAGI